MMVPIQQTKLRRVPEEGSSVFIFTAMNFPKSQVITYLQSSYFRREVRVCIWHTQNSFPRFSFISLSRLSQGFTVSYHRPLPLSLPSQIFVCPVQVLNLNEKCLPQQPLRKSKFSYGISSFVLNFHRIKCNSVKINTTYFISSRILFCSFWTKNLIISSHQQKVN